MLETQVISNDDPDVDYDEHLRTYARFLHLLKYAVAGIVCVLILMAVFLL